MMTRIGRAVLILAATVCGGCYTWRPVGLRENPDAATRPSELEVQLTRGYQGTVYGPVIKGDSLHGWQDEKHTFPVGFALKDIKSARTQQLHGGRTAVLAAGGIVVGLALWIMIALANTDWPAF